jgi:hypothetical protein
MKFFSSSDLPENPDSRSSIFSTKLKSAGPPFLRVWRSKVFIFLKNSVVYQETKTKCQIISNKSLTKLTWSHKKQNHLSFGVFEKSMFCIFNSFVFSSFFKELLGIVMAKTLDYIIRDIREIGLIEDDGRKLKFDLSRGLEENFGKGGPQTVVC